jgi:ornithine cyclodeaminase/alanine dehydrogenase-like protein (mu-crystallin family)
MTLLLKHEEVMQTVSMDDAIVAMEGGFKEEGEGGTLLPQRINVKAGKGWFRVGPVVLQNSGWVGFKAMNLAPGHGLRYQVHLYSTETGELLCIMDAQYLTTLRTGATSAVATRRLKTNKPCVVSLLGSGAEAYAQLDAMRATGYVSSARVFSPTEANRKRLAETFRTRHGMDVVDVRSAEEAVDGSEIVLAAVKSTSTVLLGQWLKPGMHVNSVGTARRDQREIDVETFTRSDVIVVDTKEGVFTEAGDAYLARDAVPTDRVSELSSVVVGKAGGRTSDSQITLFKSVGTGIQDIALAAVIYQRAKERRMGTDVGAFPYLKET